MFRLKPLTKWSRQRPITLKPDQVHPVLQTKMLVDGYPLVYNPSKSHGSYLHDDLTGRDYLDLFSFFGSASIAHNHPRLNQQSFRDKLGAIATCNPSNADIYTVAMAEFVATFSQYCMPSESQHLFLISTGTLAVENGLKVAFDWKTRKNLAKGKHIHASKVIHFQQAFHGRSGYALSLTNTCPRQVSVLPVV